MTTRPACWCCAAGLRAISLVALILGGSALTGPELWGKTETEQIPADRRTKRGHTTDTLETVKKNLKDEKALLIDVREEREWKAGHLEIAKFVPLSRLEANARNSKFAGELAKELPKEKIIYCHCKSGGRVLAATPLLEKMGYHVRPLLPGYSALVKAGFESAE